METFEYEYDMVRPMIQENVFGSCVECRLNKAKNGSKRTIQEAVELIQIKGGEGLTQYSSHVNGMKRLEMRAIVD